MVHLKGFFFINSLNLSTFVAAVWSRTFFSKHEKGFFTSTTIDKIIPFSIALDYPNNESDIDIKEEPGENVIEMTPDFTLSEPNDADGISYYFIESLSHFLVKLHFLTFPACF